MNKIILKDCVYHDKVKNHIDIKDFILNEIENDLEAETANIKDDYFDNSISKLDWYYANNFDRKWVQLFLPHFNAVIDNFLLSSLNTGITLNEMWYQQYLNNDSHGWHVHSGHYTGVYYLEFPNESSKTELFYPFDNTFHTIDVIEGDMIIFPSHIIHRGMLNKSVRKTIVSFNFSINGDKLNTSGLSDFYPIGDER